MNSLTTNQLNPLHYWFYGLILSQLYSKQTLGELAALSQGLKPLNVERQGIKAKSKTEFHKKTIFFFSFSALFLGNQRDPKHQLVDV